MEGSDYTLGTADNGPDAIIILSLSLTPAHQDQGAFEDVTDATKTFQNSAVRRAYVAINLAKIEQISPLPFDPSALVAEALYLLMESMRLVIADLTIFTHTDCIGLFHLLVWRRDWERTLHKSFRRAFTPSKNVFSPLHRMLDDFFAEKAMDNGKNGPKSFASLFQLV